MANHRHNVENVGFRTIFLLLLLSIDYCKSVTEHEDGHPEHMLCPSIPNCHCPEPRLVICSQRNLTNLALPESTTNITFRQVNGDSFNISRLVQLRWKESQLTDITTIILSPINLELLDLAENNIRNIRNYQFLNFTKLKFLNLSNNVIDDLPRNCCQGLDLLEELYLSGNRLHAIPFQVFAPLTNLKVLDLSHNYMVTFLDHFFRPNKLIHTLILNNNRISKLTSNALADLTELRVLQLNDNSLISFAKGIFDSLKHLEYLYIGGNPLLNLNKDIFSSLLNLRYLNLGYNNLTKIPSDLFISSNNLETLFLDGTKLEVLRDQDFKGLYNLHSLQLSHNKRLRKLEHRIFMNTLKIRNLNISGNSLTFLPHSLENLTEIEKLDMADNQWACDCRMRWFATWGREREKIFKSALSCGPGSYPNDMLPILFSQNCTVPRLVSKTETKR